MIHYTGKPKYKCSKCSVEVPHSEWVTSFGFLIGNLLFCVSCLEKHLQAAGVGTLQRVPDTEDWSGPTAQSSSADSSRKVVNSSQ